MNGLLNVIRGSLEDLRLGLDGALNVNNFFFNFFFFKFILFKTLILKKMTD